MNGIVKIEITTRRVCYSLELRHNITIIQGDSGTGKSILCDLISRKANRQGSAIALAVTHNYACRHFTNEMCEAGMLHQVSNSVIFLDEDCDYIYTNDFAQQLLGSTNYFVLITRHIKRLSKLSIHINAMCELQYIEGVNTLVRQYPLAEDKTLMCGDSYVPEKIVTEDSGSGLRFFKLIAGADCITAKGRSKFVSDADRLFETAYKYLIVADGGAIGSNICQIIYTLQNLHLKSFAFYLPDSFEEMLLHSNIFKSNRYISECLKAPWDYIDYSKYISFEQFYTGLLIKATTDLGFMYNKTGTLSTIFTNKANVNRLLGLITHIDFCNIQSSAEDGPTSLFTEPSSS